MHAAPTPDNPIGETVIVRDIDIVSWTLRGMVEVFKVQPDAIIVLSVPAYYNSEQVSDLRDAITAAGISIDRVRNILQEPVSAAFGAVFVENLVTLDKNKLCRILLLDIGGGTGDAR